MYLIRGGDAGRAVFADNWDAQKQQPKFMLDPQKTNQRALKWDDLILRKLGFDDVYFISEGTAVPFDATMPGRMGIRSRGGYYKRAMDRMPTSRFRDRGVGKTATGT